MVVIRRLIPPSSSLVASCPFGGGTSTEEEEGTVLLDIGQTLLLYGMDGCHLYHLPHQEELNVLKAPCLPPFHYRLLWYLKNWVPKCGTFVSWVNSAVHFESQHSSLLRWSHCNLVSHPDVIILPHFDPVTWLGLNSVFWQTTPAVSQVVLPVDPFPSPPSSQGTWKTVLASYWNKGPHLLSNPLICQSCNLIKRENEMSLARHLLPKVLRAFCSDNPCSDLARDWQVAYWCAAFMPSFAFHLYCSLLCFKINT